MLMLLPCPHRGDVIPGRLAKPNCGGCQVYECLHPAVAGPCVVTITLPKAHEIVSCQRCQHRPKELRQRGDPRGGWITIPPPPPLALAPRSPRALVTIGVGEEAQRLLAGSRPAMQAYARHVGADFVELAWPGHPEWPMSCKYAIPRVLDHYPRIAYVDSDVLFRPGCVNLFDLCHPDEFGAFDELPHVGRQHDHQKSAYQTLRREMGFEAVPHIPFYFNAGVLVVSRGHRELLAAPAGPMPKGHCCEQDHTNARVLDAFRAGQVQVRLLDRRANWQNWTDPGFACAPPDAILHYSGGGEIRKTRVQDLAAEAARHPWR